MSLRSRSLDRREHAIALRENDLERISKPGKFARISQPVSFSGDQTIGFGDSTHARNIIQRGIKGSAASAQAVIRDRIRGLPMGVFSRRFINGDFEDKPQFGHPLQRILDNPTFVQDPLPNRDPTRGSITHSAQQLWGMVVSHYLSVGESYLIVLTDGAGIPIRLQIAQPGALEPKVEGGRVTAYRVIGATSARNLRPQDVIRIWEPETYELFSARGVMVQQADEINMDHAVTETWTKFFQNNATPPILFETDNPEAPPPTPQDEREENERMIRRFARRMGSLLGGAKYIKPGWKAKVIDSTLESAAGVQMMEWTSQQVFEGYRVSPTMVGRSVAESRATAETARFVTDMNTMLPLTRLIEEALTLQLASHYPQPSGDVTLVVKYRPFIDQDKAHELVKDEVDARLFIRSVNEIREDREPAMPAASWGEFPLGSPLIGPITGEVQEPVDLSQFGLEETEESETIPPVPDEGTEEEETPPEERGRSLTLGGELRRMRAAFAPEKEWQRVLDRETRFTPKFQANQQAVFKRQIEVTLERYIESQEGRGERARIHCRENIVAARAEADDLAKIIFPIDGWQGMFGEALTPVRTAAFVASATEATEAITGQLFRMTDSARAILKSQNASHYLFVNETTQTNVTNVLRQALSDGIGTEETASRLATTMGDSSLVRSRAIARTEMGAATQSAQLEGYTQTGVVDRVMWNTSLDSDVRDSHTIEGQTIDLEQGELFTLGDGDQGPSPRSPLFDVTNRVNCRCFVTPVFFEEDALNIGVRPAANEG